MTVTYIVLGVLVLCILATGWAAFGHDRPKDPPS